MPGGYEEIYLKLIPRLADCDFAESAERLGLELTKEGVTVSFLCRKYLITKEGAESVDGRNADVNNLSVLLYYVLSKGSGMPKNSYVPLFRLTGMLEGRSRLTNIMDDPLIAEFGNDYGKFSAAAAKLGGVCENESSGRHEWLFALLPKIPAKVVFMKRMRNFRRKRRSCWTKTLKGFWNLNALLSDGLFRQGDDRNVAARRWAG